MKINEAIAVINKVFTDGIDHWETIEEAPKYERNFRTLEMRNKATGETRKPDSSGNISLYTDEGRTKFKAMRLREFSFYR